MERRQRWLRRWAVFFFLGTLFWSASVFPQQRQIRRHFDDVAPATTGVRVPPVVNMRLDHAEQDIVDAKLRMGQITRIRHDQPRGNVVRQSPAAGTPVQPGSSVALWVSLGPGQEPEQVRVRVPPVVNMQLDHAEQDIVDAKLRMGRVTRIKHDRPRGIVVRQSPAAGTPVQPGSSVALWVSLGPGQEEQVRVRVPPVVNLQVDHAEQDIGNARLRVGQVTRIRHDRPRGIVVRQSPAASTPVPPGSLVALWVSLGPGESREPEKVQVPNLSQKSPQEAGELLEDRGLALGRRVHEDSGTTREGTIMRQQPGAGEWVNRGRRVNVWIAKRPEKPPPPPPRLPPERPQEMTRVPDLTGKTSRQARGFLNSSRLRQGAVGKSYSLGSAGTIVKQDPPAGMEVRVGSMVNLWVAQPIPPWIWAVFGFLALTLVYIATRLLIRKPRPGPQPVSLEAKAALDTGRFEVAWKDGEGINLELRLRAKPDLGTQDLEAPGPLVKKERREHE